MPTLTFPMRFQYRAAVAALALLGLVGIVFGALALAGFTDLPESRRWIEGAAALAFGALVAPIAASALRVARLELSTKELRYLRVGLPCALRPLPLGSVRRHGWVKEKRKGRTRTLLLLETRDGRCTILQASMYERTAELRAALRERLGREPDLARATYLGARFEELWRA